MTTREVGADHRALAAGMMRLLGLSAGYGERLGGRAFSGAPPGVPPPCPGERDG